MEKILMNNTLLKSIIESVKLEGNNVTDTTYAPMVEVRTEMQKSLMKQFNENFNEAELVEAYKATMFESAHAVIPLVMHAIQAVHQKKFMSSDKTMSEKEAYHFNAIIADSIINGGAVSKQEASKRADLAFYNTDTYNNQGKEMFISAVVLANKGDINLYPANKQDLHLYNKLTSYAESLAKKSEFNAPSLDSVTEKLSAQQSNIVQPVRTPKVSM